MEDGWMGYITWVLTFKLTNFVNNFLLIATTVVEVIMSLLYQDLT